MTWMAAFEQCCSCSEASLWVESGSDDVQTSPREAAADCTFWGWCGVPSASGNQPSGERTRRRRSEWSNSSSNLSGWIHPPRALKRRPAHLSIEPQPPNPKATSTAAGLAAPIMVPSVQIRSVRVVTDSTRAMIPHSARGPATLPAAPGFHRRAAPAACGTRCHRCGAPSAGG